MDVRYQFGDQSIAEALRIAERWLLQQGWKFTPADVGAKAKLILDALPSPPDLDRKD